MSAFDTVYERKAVLLLFLGFGLVGLDRWIIAPLFPAMMRDLHLDYQDLGNAVGALALCWGVFSMLMGNLSDRFGRRRILIPALLAFSALSGVTGLVVAVPALLVTRGLMGATEGAFLSTSVALTAEASHPRRRGLNQGIQLCGFSLFGLGLGPIIATQLLAVAPSWRWVFVIVAFPGLLIALLCYRIIREPPYLQRLALPSAAVAAARPRWSAILRSRNVLLAMFGLLCGMSCVFVMGAMVPNYLVDYLHLSPQRMGLVTSGLGFGGCVGGIAVPALSDLCGRRLIAVLSFAATAVLLYCFAHSAAPVVLFVLLFGISFFGAGVLSLLTGPVATEAVPARLTSSAVGAVSGTGEIFGGGIAPVLCGYVARHFGIQHVLSVALVGALTGTATCLLLRETAPRRVAATAGAPTATATIAASETGGD